jgi:hypothetical protein
MNSKLIKFNTVALAEMIRVHNIKFIEVEFSGEGDSGSIEHVSVSSRDWHADPIRGPAPAQPTDWKAIEAEKARYDIDTSTPCKVYRQAGTSFADGKLITTEEGPSDGTLQDLIEELAYALADDHDWYNNDGGFGTMRYTESEGFEFAQHQRYTQTEQVVDIAAPSIAAWLAEFDAQEVAE